jgi:polysaccharide biosynthesis protein VpsM
MTQRNISIAALVVALSTGAIANAQTSPIRPSYQFPTNAATTQAGPAAIQVADSPLYLTPYFGLAAGHDDNVLLTHTNQRSSTLYIASPGFRIDARSPGLVYQGSYQAQIGRYVDSKDDDYVDHATHNQLDLAFGRRSFLRLGYDFIRSHDARGSTDRAISTSPDKYQLISPSATYAFGAPGAQGRVELYLTDGYKTYENNRLTTRLSDRDTRDVGSAFYWRVMPKTYLVLDVRGTDVHYRAHDSNLSSEERRYLVGVTWDATAATSGTFKAGRLKKEFDDPSIPSFSGTSWEGTITWAPRSYSTFDFYTARTTNEATGLGNFILSDIYGVSWNHAWNSVVSTGLNVRRQRDEYQGFNRTDDLTVLGLKAGYRFRRWLTLGAEYVYTRRDSNQNIFEYDKNLYLLTATASM